MSEGKKLGFFDWLRGLTGNASADSDFQIDPFADDDESSGISTMVNPANGLPMIDDCCGVDVMGNDFGCSDDDWLM